MLLVLRVASMSGLPFYIAEEKGFFDKENIQIRCLHSPDPKRRVVQLLADGEVAFYTSISAIVEGIIRGVKVKALCATGNSKYPCAARNSIHSFADLKNKKIMVGTGRSRNEVLWLCRGLGWQPERDLEMVSGDLAERAQAFSDPTFAAVFGRPQYLSWLKKSGFHLLPYPDPDDAWPEGCLATSQKLIDERPELVQKVVNAVVAATEFARSNKPKALEIAMHHVGYLGADEVEGNYDVLREWYSNDISETAIKHIVEVLELKTSAAQPIRLRDFVDLSFLARAHKNFRDNDQAT